MTHPDRELASEVIRQAPVGIFQTDEHGRCIDVNARWCDMVGFPREQALGHGWVAAVHPEDRERVAGAWSGAVREGREFVLEYRYLSRGGTTLWVLGHAVAVRDAHGRVMRYVGTATDITARKMAEELAVRSADTLRALFDQLPEPVLVHRFGPIAFANSAAERALGYSLDELRRLGVDDVLPRDERERVWQRIDLLREARPAVNALRMTRLRRKDGSLALFEVTAVRAEFEHRPAVIVMLHDVSARTAREATLRASLEGLSDAVFILDCERDARGGIEDFRIAEVNLALERLLGRPKDALVGERLSTVMDADTLGALFDVYVRATELREPSSQELELPRLGVWVRHQVLPLPNGAVASFHDVTEQRRADERLRESEERWSFALEGTNQGVWDWNVRTGDVFFSKRFKSMLGFEEHEMPNRVEEWVSRVHPDDWPEVERQVARHFRGETPYYETEHRVRCKDGRYLWILDRGRVTSWSTKHEPLRMVGTHTDISKSKETERLLRQSLREKETLLKEVHHRVKNNLQVTSSLLSLQSSRASDAATRSALQEARGRIHSIALLHEWLYRAEDVSHVPLSKYTEQLTAQIRRTHGRDEVSVMVDAEDVAVALDVATPYALVLNELVSNALEHAFPSGRGTVSVRLRQLGDAVELEVRDDGRGFPPGFDPERSSSLGMRLVRLLATQLEGSMSIRNDDGAVITVRFPRAGNADLAERSANDSAS